MKRFFVAVALFFFISSLAVRAYADLDTFMSNLNIQAKADMSAFSVKLAAQFGIALPQVQAIINKVEFPADAFMCLHLGRVTNKTPEMVLDKYKNKKGKGWGAFAQELGIKPGSANFQALKRGDFQFTGKPGKGGDKRQDKGKDKGKGSKKSILDSPVKPGNGNGMRGIIRNTNPQHKQTGNITVTMLRLLPKGIVAVSGYCKVDEGNFSSAGGPTRAPL